MKEQTLLKVASLCVLGIYWVSIYRVSINSFRDYKHLLQENYVEYKHIFFTITYGSF